MAIRKLEYKPLLFTTTLRNPGRIKDLLHIFNKFNGQILTNDLTINIMGELIKYGLYKPMKSTDAIRNKWSEGIVLDDHEVKLIIDSNPQHHKEAGFERGWPSRFATIFDFTKELGFVYYWVDQPIQFSEIGNMLANSVDIQVTDKIIAKSVKHPEFEQQAFLHAFAKSQRKNPFVRVLNDNIPLILLLEVIKKLNADKDFNGAGIARHELPLIIFWKDNNSESLYMKIKDLRNQYGFTPSDEVIVDICVDDIMAGSFKKFNPKSIISEYPDEFIRKMRLTGLISIRGGGRFIDINTNEIDKVNYILKNYSEYKTYDDELEYFKYMSTIDENLILISTKIVNPVENNKLLSKWVEMFPWNILKSELLGLTSGRMSSNNILKYLSGPIRLEFLTSIAIKSKFPNVTVIPNYPCDDEGIPTSTAGGQNNQGDIECFEGENGILIEVTMSQGRSQTVMEVWPISRHLEVFSGKVKASMCYFIAPTIFKDSYRQIEFVKHTDNLNIRAFSIQDFLDHIEKQPILYYN